MADEQKTNLRLEIAHVLFIDIVGYSKLSTDEQSEALHELNAIVRRTEVAQTAETAGRLIFLPTGDGMALVFTGSEEEPVECALEIAQGLRAKPSLPVRMGIHSGPVHHVADGQPTPKHCRGWDQCRPTNHGLRRRRPHPDFKTGG